MANKRDLMLALKEQGCDFYVTVNLQVAMRGVPTMKDALDLINAKVGSLIDERWGNLSSLGDIKCLAAVKPRKVKKASGVQRGA